jgi:hypothetical protein
MTEASIGVVGTGPGITHVVVARGRNGDWFVWSSHSSLAAAERSATKGRLASGTRRIIALEAQP